MKTKSNRQCDRMKLQEQTANALRQILAIEPCVDGSSQSYEVAFSMKLPKNQHLITKGIKK